MKMISVCSPSTTEKEIEYVNKALKENEISSIGKYTKIFEERFANYVGTNYAVAVNSGGSALFVTLKGLDIQKGDEVICPTFTMIATACAIVHAGATPVFVDCEANGNIDVDLIEEKITPRTKAIISVDIYGHPCDYDELHSICRRYGLWLVDDAAEAHGSEYKGKKIGSLADFTCFSLYANKTITSGEGGMITLNNERFYNKMIRLRQYDMGYNEHFFHAGLGWNLRMSSLNAAYGLGQLDRIEELIEKRIKNAERYKEGLKNVVSFLPVKNYVKNTYWMFGILTEHKDELIEYLAENGIETRSFFQPLNTQTALKEYTRDNFPTAMFLWERGMYLPSSSDLSIEDQDYVIQTIKQFYEHQKS